MVSISDRAEEAKKRLLASRKYATEQAIRAAKLFDEYSVIGNQPGTVARTVASKDIEPGKSGATVQYEKPPLRVESITPYKSGSEEAHSLKIGQQDPGKVLKDNRTPKLQEIELAIYHGLKEAGLSVPKVVVKDGKLCVERVDGQTLDQKTSDIYTRAGLGISNTKKALLRFQDILYRAIELSSKADSLVGNILSDEQKAYLENRVLERLAQRFDQNPEQIRGELHTYKVMETLTKGYDSEFVRLFSGLEDALQRNLQERGKWIADVHPKNIVVGPNGELTLIDFNHPEYAVPGMADSVLLDAYMPIKSGNEILFLSPFLTDDGRFDESQKRFLVQKGKTTKLEKSFRDYYLARQYRCQRLAGRSAQELGEVPSFQEMNDKMHETKYYGSQAQIALAILEQKNGLDTEDLRGYIQEKHVEKIKAALGKDGFEDTFLYMRYGELPIIKKYGLYLQPAD